MNLSTHNLQHELSKPSVDSVLLCLDGITSIDIAPVLDRLQETHENGKVAISGKLRNLRVKATDTGTIIYGSLPKFLYDTNLVPLDCSDVECVLHGMARRLEIPVDTVLSARVYRIDVAANLVVTRPPVDYVRALMEVRRAIRIVYSPASVTFTNKTREFAFYDKVAEVQSKGGEAPELPDGTHLLRYEIRFKKRVKREFGYTVLGEDLINPSFYELLAIKWESYLSKVQINRPFRLDYERTVQELRNALALHGIGAVGGMSAVLDGIDDACALGIIKSYTASRLRSWVRSITSSPKLTVESDLAIELAQAAHDAAQLVQLSTYRKAA